jgi:hypothetical protein
VQPRRTDAPSLEKGRCYPGLFLVLKVAQADTYEAVASLWAKIRPSS